MSLTTNKPPNGLRYPLVGGTRERHFDGTHLKSHKVLENAQTPTSRVHAVLGGVETKVTLYRHNDRILYFFKRLIFGPQCCILSSLIFFCFIDGVSHAAPV